MKTVWTILFFYCLASSPAFAKVTDEFAMDPSKVKTRQHAYSVKGTLYNGQYKKVRFEIPKSNILIGLDINVLSRYPEDNNPFSALSITGWRLIQLDKFPEYNSNSHPKTTFTVEMWAHKYGQWYAPKNSEIKIQVSYIYYDLEGVSEEEFNNVVDQTLSNIHPMPVHISAKEAFEQIDLNDTTKGIEEVFLRSDRRCYWGSRTNCSDCVLTKYNNATGQRTHRYFYNARSFEGYCN